MGLVPPATPRAPCPVCGGPCRVYPTRQSGGFWGYAACFVHGPFRVDCRATVAGHFPGDAWLWWLLAFMGLGTLACGVVQWLRGG